jgi:nitrogen fixation protein NifB
MSVNIHTEDTMMNPERSNKDFIKTHPCFSEEAHTKFGRAHLSVAPACNIQCRYCIRKFDCANESRPGITSRVLTPDEAVERTRVLVERSDRLSVVGIAGPGDPLVNAPTYVVLRHINWEYPDLTLCVSTNGLLLPDKLEQLIASGVRSLTVTINAVSPETAEKVYQWVIYHGRRYEGRAAAELLLANQWLGLEKAVHAGLVVKVNTVFIPGVNDAEIPQIAERAGKLGAVIMNILPLIPQAEFAGLKRPSHAEITKMREVCRPFIKQMTHCKQCRADACGILGEDKDMELEVLMTRIGEEYNEVVC